jgi:hypothetical protein
MTRGLVHLFFAALTAVTAISAPAQSEPIGIVIMHGKGGGPDRLVADLAVPAAYVTWFDPEGAMNLARAAGSANPHVPILWMVAKRDCQEPR